MEETRSLEPVQVMLIAYIIVIFALNANTSIFNKGRDYLVTFQGMTLYDRRLNWAWLRLAAGDHLPIVNRNETFE